MDELLRKYGPEVLWAVADRLAADGWAAANHADDLVDEIRAAVEEVVLDGPRPKRATTNAGSHQS